MGHIPSPDEAFEILKKYNSEDFHLQHAKTVAKVLGELAKEYDPGNEGYWFTVGLLHDIDFELYPKEHCKKAPELLHENDVDESIIHAVVSHGYGIAADVKPERYMEKVLFAVDELTGLIGAAAVIRPTGMSDLETPSVMKKLKKKDFAAACSRETIAEGAAMMGVELAELVTMTLTAMKA